MASPWLTPLRPISRFGETLLDRVLCVAGAVGLSQAPEFYQQYLQRLGGHLDEAVMQLARFQAVAHESGITLAELIATTRAQAAEPVARLGAVIVETEARVQELRLASDALKGATFWERPWAFLRHADPDIMAGTWTAFKPAVPVTLEGLFYAGAGMVLALVIYQGAVVWPVRVAARKWRIRRARVDLTKASTTYPTRPAP